MGMKLLEFTLLGKNGLLINKNLGYLTFYYKYYIFKKVKSTPEYVRNTGAKFVIFRNKTYKLNENRKKFIF